jgi:flagellar basal-body rod modification protein FlgD
MNGLRPQTPRLTPATGGVTEHPGTAASPPVAQAGKPGLNFMAVDSIPSVTAYPGQTASESRIPVKTLDQQDFLKLLVAQMTQQDPLNPKSDLEMIPQMVSFTTLEQSKSMQTDIAQLRAEQQMLQANSLLGRTVEIQDESKARFTGQVTAVQMEEGTPKLVVNGKRYDLYQLVSISPTTLN